MTIGSPAGVIWTAPGVKPMLCIWGCDRVAIEFARLEPHAHTAEFAGDPPRSADQRLNASDEPVVLGPVPDPHPRLGGTTQRGVVDSERRSRIRSDGNERVDVDRCRPDASERVLAARSEYGVDVDPAPDGEIGPHRTRRHVDAKPGSGCDGVAAGVGAAGDHERSQRLENERPHRLDRRCVGRIADEAVHQVVGSSIDGTGRRHAEMGQSPASSVLHRGGEPGLDDAQRRRRRHAATRRNRTDRPGCSSAGGLRSASHSTAVVCPIRYHPPGDADG